MLSERHCSKIGVIVYFYGLWSQNRNKHPYFIPISTIPFGLLINIYFRKTIWWIAFVKSISFMTCFTASNRTNNFENVKRFITFQVQQISYTVQLTLAGNRLACDCNTLWLKQWLVTRRHQVTDIDEVLCGSGQAQVLAQVGSSLVCSTNLSQYGCVSHYNDVIMSAMASQITSLKIVYPTVYSGADQRKHQSSVSLAFMWGIHRWSVNSPHKWPVTLKIFPFDDVIVWA